VIPLPEEELEEVYSGKEWKLFFTGTLAGEDVTQGAVFLALSGFAGRLLQEDGSADFILWLCQRQDAPHVHGVIRTSLSPRAVNRLWKGGLACTRPFRPDLGGSLLSYIRSHDVQLPFTKE
jgi:hypothetical protein